MANRSSRSKKKRTRSSAAKPTAERTGTSRAARAQRSMERAEAATSSTATGRRVGVRPAGVLGSIVQFGLAWAAVFGVVYVGLVLGRWNVLSYPDSLWLWVAFGVVAVSPALGSVARARSDADGWGAQAVLVPFGMLVAETAMGPSCPDGGACGAIGARGSLGAVGSFVLVLALGILAWQLAGYSYRRAVARRPATGRVTAPWAAFMMVIWLVFVGVPIGIALASSDILLRSTPKLVELAKEDVTGLCFPITPKDPDLSVRANPEGVYSGWTSLLVRNTNEKRTGVSGAKLTGDWTALERAHIYEAMVTYDAEGEPALPVRCRMVVPSTGVAVPADAKADPIEETELSSIDPIKAGDGAQLHPKFFAQDLESIESARKSAADAAKAEKAEAEKQAKADAAKADEKPKTDEKPKADADG